VAIYRGTLEYIPQKSRNKTYTSDEQLHPIGRGIYHGIKFKVESLDGERIAQMSRCTGSETWRGVDPWNNWVSVKEHAGRYYGALNGHLPLHLQLLFKMKLINEDGTFVQYWLALALATIPENSGNLDPILKCQQMRNVPAAVTLQAFSVGNILSCAHIVPEIATSRTIGDRRNA
jgi:hypothetical protein